MMLKEKNDHSVCWKTEKEEKNILRDIDCTLLHPKLAQSDGGLQMAVMANRRKTTPPISVTVKI